MVFRNNFNFFVIIALLCSHKVTLRIKLFANDLLYDQRNTNRFDEFLVNYNFILYIYNMDFIYFTVK